MPTRLLLSAACCSILATATTNVYAQLPLREAPRADAASLRSLFSPDVTSRSILLAQRPFTATATTSTLLWPSLTGPVVRVLQTVPSDCKTYLVFDDRLWGVMPDGGLVRWVGTTMEYEAPVWELR